MKTVRTLTALLLALVLLLTFSACALQEDDLAAALQTASEIAAALEEASELPEEVPEPTQAPAPAETPVPPDLSLPEEDNAGVAREPALDPDGWYTTKEDVALYLHLYGKLPENFITKSEAQALGWSGGGLDGYADGCSIGGDRFGNYEGLLPEGSYRECDLNTMHASSRGAERLVYSDDGRIYYTNDHYESFTLLYGEE